MEWVALIILMSMISLAGWWVVFGSKRSTVVPPDENLLYPDLDDVEDSSDDADFDD
jgi:hypothetical protein